MSSLSLNVLNKMSPSVPTCNIFQLYESVSPANCVKLKLSPYRQMYNSPYACVRQKVTHSLSNPASCTPPPTQRHTHSHTQHADCSMFVSAPRTLSSSILVAPRRLLAPPSPCIKPKPASLSERSCKFVKSKRKRLLR